jgi:membrane-anchored protein YejM (alkaline phosphatase superfamily)
MKNPSRSPALLPVYFAITYFILLAINQGTVDLSGGDAGWTGAVFSANAFLSYNLIYLTPAMLLTWLAGRPALWRLLRWPDAASKAGLAVAALGGGVATLFFHANAKLFELYGMFVNGFVINLIVTPGGLESLGGSDATNLGFVLIGAAFLVGHVLLLWGLHVLLRRVDLAHVGWRRLGKAVLLVFLLSTLSDRFTYAYADAYGKSELMGLTQGVPYYTGLTMRKTLRKLGFHPISQQKVVRIKGDVHYPLSPIKFERPNQPYNIVWLVSESWRADTLNAEIMPRSWDFARQAQNFRLHYSGGNGTRIGVFTMMTGVPGSYWEYFLQDRRSAPLIDVLQQQDYQMALYSSAHFSYPEFDQTIFSKIPHEQLHEVKEKMQGWEKDRKNVSDMLEFIDKRDLAKPFFTWMFFESPHARYYFPAESVVRRPYQDDINYATMDRGDLRENIDLIRNRYLNSVHHLDSQFARVIDHLKARNLLDRTIVVLVGDHGEEFMEHGFWGHNSTFSDPQTRTPLVLWIPGLPAAAHDRLTSHLDLPATIMPLLGVGNPSSDYSIGYNLISGPAREHVLLSDWSNVGYRDHQVKITMPINAQGGVGRKVVGPNDQLLSKDQIKSLFQGEQHHLTGMLKEMGRFTR